MQLWQLASEASDGWIINFKLISTHNSRLTSLETTRTSLRDSLWGSQLVAL